MLEIGRIGKPHGVGGHVVVTFVSDRPERRKQGAVFSSSVGDLTVLSIRPHKERWIVDFGFPNREIAAERTGTLLMAEPLEDEDEIWVHELVGAVVVDQGGTERGTVTEVQANPASDLLMLDSGAIVPLNFVVGNVADGKVHVDVPDGLFELYEGE